MTKLSVNINKIATLRNSRGGEIPNVFQFALDCERYGADGITIHPRPDERHIRKTDVYELNTQFPNTTCEFNIEGYPSDDFIKMVCETNPTQCTLVPDPPHVLTSSAGWDTWSNNAFLKEVISELKTKNIRVALFIEDNEKMIEGAANVGADRIEYYTGEYAAHYTQHKEKAIEGIVKTSKLCDQLGLGINAGHDLNLENLAYLKQQIPNLMEVSIGHALVRDCLYFGLENTIQLYKRCLL